MKNFQYEYVKNLPDKYAKSKTSNNYKILEIERLAWTDLQTTLNEIHNILDIRNARGKTLDEYGDRVGQVRGNATDSQYEYMILAKIMRTLTDGSDTSIINAVCKTFDCDPSQVLIVEKDEPCVVELITLPLGVIVAAGLTTKQTVALIATMLPAGVRLESFVFEGTFTFSDREDEYDAEAGFCDVEDGTLGGYFGLLYGEDEEVVLPI